MKAWLRRRLGMDVFIRELAATREALAETSRRVDDLWDRQRADAEEARRSLDDLRRDMEDRTSSAADRTNAMAERADAIAERGEALTGRIEGQERRLDEAEETLRRAIEEQARPIDMLRTEIRRLDIRLRTHVEETGRTTAALLDRTGFPRLADDASHQR